MDFIKDAIESATDFFYKNSGVITYVLTGVYMSIPETINYVSFNFSAIKERIFRKKNLEKKL